MLADFLLVNWLDFFLVLLTAALPKFFKFSTKI